MGDLVVFNAALRKAWAGTVAVNLENQGRVHALSIAITTKLFLPGCVPLQGRFLQHLPCKGYGARMKERRCHQQAQNGRAYIGKPLRNLCPLNAGVGKKTHTVTYFPPYFFGTSRIRTMKAQSLWRSQ